MDMTSFSSLASWPTKMSFSSIPTISFWGFGFPTIVGKQERGASSPENPILHTPEPLSTTIAGDIYSVAIFVLLYFKIIVIFL